MKKLVLLFVMAATVGLAKAELPLALGLKFGYVNSKYTLNGISDGIADESGYTYKDFKDDTKNGYQIGAMARVKFGEKLFLQPELYYAAKKGEGSFTGVLDGNEIGYEQQMTFHNMDIPILVNYKLLDLKLAQLNVFAGPSASFVMKETVKLNTDGGGWEKIDPTNADMKSAQWNAQFGVGVDVLMLSFDVRYETGLNEISESFKSKGSFLTFSLAWRIFG